MAHVISVELTPNYEARKFRVDVPLGRVFPRSFKNGDTVEGDPYAQALLAVPGVAQAYFDLGFVTVNKTAEANWNDLAAEVKTALEGVSFDGGFAASASAATACAATAAGASAVDADDSDLLGRIEEALNMHIRPHLANDGGGLELLALKENHLTIRYQGACGGCRSALTGTLFAIENCLQSYVDQRLTVGIG